MNKMAARTKNRKNMNSWNARALFTVIAFAKWILTLNKIIPKMADIGFDEISLSSQTYLKALTISK